MSSQQEQLTPQQRKRVREQHELASERRRVSQVCQQLNLIAPAPAPAPAPSAEGIAPAELLELEDWDCEVDFSCSKFRYFRSEPLRSQDEPITLLERSQVSQRHIAPPAPAPTASSPSPGASSPSALPEIIMLADSDCDFSCSSQFRYFQSKPLDKPITLSLEQLQVLKAVAACKSVFVTGAAGTGKSFVLELAIKVLKLLHNRNNDNHVFVTASTGLAAFPLNGTTLHSFAGVGLGNASKEKLLSSMTKDSRQRWKKAKALVIDEISMIDAELFSKIDYIARQLRCDKRPFGGVQLIVTGDFFQLPPVGEIKSFAFNAKCWNESFDLQLELTHVFRQQDGKFVDLLNEIRRGFCSPESYQMLKAAGSNAPSRMGINPTTLYPRRNDVDSVNEQRLKELGSKRVSFTSKDMGKVDALSRVRAERLLVLAVGAQVMLIKNIDLDKKLVNGSRGVVVNFVPPRDRTLEISDGGGWPTVRFMDGSSKVIKPECWSVVEGDREVAARIQIPLVLAWASTVHKCQGMTLDCVETDLSRTFEDGMVYVALSRVKSLDGLRLLSEFDPMKVKAHPRVIHFYNELGKAGKAVNEQLS